MRSCEKSEMDEVQMVTGLGRWLALGRVLGEVDEEDMERLKPLLALDASGDMYLNVM